MESVLGKTVNIDFVPNIAHEGTIFLCFVGKHKSECVLYNFTELFQYYTLS